MMILAHDLGTSGNKASLYSTDGEHIASAVHPYQTHYSHSGKWAEQNPNDWWEAVCFSTKKIMQGRNPADILAVAFSGQMMGCLCLDKAGLPLNNSIIWQDSRAEHEADSIIERLGDKQEASRIVGQQLTANYALAKLKWIKNNMPDVYKNTYKVIAAKDYITFRMTGQFATDHSDAAFMQAYDMSSRSWSSRLIEAAEVDGEMFPDIMESTDVVGHVTSNAAAEMGIIPDIPVMVGAGDGPCAALGAGAAENGDSYLCIGTSTWLSTLTDKYVPDPEGRLQVYPFASKDIYCIAGTMQAGGLSYSWARKQFFDKPTSYSEIDDMISHAPVGAGSVFFLPYLMGERSPWWNVHARGAFIGMSAETQRGHMLRAVLEGVAMNLQLIREDIKRFCTLGNELNIIGGGAEGAVWRHIIADVLETTVRKSHTTEIATSFGAAIIAAVGAGIFPDLRTAKKLVRISDINAPVPENVSIYKEKTAIFRDIYLALKPIYERIAK